MAQSKEEVVLGRLQELGLTVQVFNDALAHHNSDKKSTDGINKSNSESAMTYTAEETFARLFSTFVLMSPVCN